MYGLTEVGTLMRFLERQTRSHNDIYIFVQKKDAKAFTEMLSLDGYCKTEMEYTTDDHTGWSHSNGCIIDFHLFEFGETETLRFENEINLLRRR
jgi:hypothetical protein